MVNLYKKLYTLIGGRPWTYIIRDTWHRYEWFWIIGWMMFGAYLGQRYGFQWIIDRVCWITLGYILGHFFWGTPYEENQQGD